MRAVQYGAVSHIKSSMGGRHAQMMNSGGGMSPPHLRRASCSEDAASTLLPAAVCCAAALAAALGSRGRCGAGSAAAAAAAASAAEAADADAGACAAAAAAAPCCSAGALPLLLMPLLLGASLLGTTLLPLVVANGSFSKLDLSSSLLDTLHCSMLWAGLPVSCPISRAGLPATSVRGGTGLSTSDPAATWQAVGRGMASLG